MRFVAVIPARFGSTRLAAKPLRNIAGKPLLSWVIERGKQVRGLDELVVATDHPEIMELAESCGVRGILTDPDLPSGTDRVYVASQQMSADVVFNIQGDEALLDPKWVEALMAEFQRDSSVKIGTVATDLQASELDSTDVVKVLLNKNSDSIYFSRFGIPHSRKGPDQLEVLPLKHIGLYGYRVEALAEFCKQPVSSLEQAESLEQLRALDMGVNLRVVRVTGESVGVDTEEDILKIESIVSGRNNG